MQVHGFVAAPVNLPPAGHPLRHGEPFALPKIIPFHQVRDLWAWADQAHIAFQDIKQLWQFIEAGAAQEASAWHVRNAVALWVRENLAMLFRPRIPVVPPRTRFENPEV